MPKVLETSFVIRGDVSQSLISSMTTAAECAEQLNTQLNQLKDLQKAMQQFDLLEKKLLNTAAKLKQLEQGSAEWTRTNAALEKIIAQYSAVNDTLQSAGINVRYYNHELWKLNEATRNAQIAADRMKQTIEDEAREVRNLAQAYAAATQQLARMNAQEQARVNGTYQAWMSSSPQNINIPGADNINYSSSSVEGSLYNAYRQSQLQNELSAIDKNEAAQVEAWQKSFRSYWGAKQNHVDDNSDLLLPGNNSKIFAALNGMGLGRFAAGMSSALPYFLVGLAAKGVFDFGRASLSESMGLEQVMSEVAAYTTASNAELRVLTNKAKQIGLNTVFSAQEAGKAMTYLGKAGWTTAEINAGIKGVMNLAAASGEDLSLTSSIVADALGAFGMSSAEAQHFADVLAKTATRSNTDVGLIGNTFKMSAPVAGALGYSIEDVSQMIGLMANVGIKGSLAGTTTRNILSALATGFTISGSAIGDYTYTAMKSDGTMKSLRETTDELRDVFSQLTKDEKVVAANEIAGKRGYAGLLGVVNATTDAYERLAEEIRNADGAAEEMAKRRQDNLQGDVKLFKDAWSALKTEVGETLTPVARFFTQVGTSAITNLTNNIKADRGAAELIKLKSDLAFNSDDPGLKSFENYYKEAFLGIENGGNPDFYIRNYLQHIYTSNIISDAMRSYIEKQYGDTYSDLGNGYSMSEAALRRKTNGGGLGQGLKELKDEYDELAEAAETSIERQFELWEQAAEVIPKDIYDLLDAQESQIEYWKEYEANLDSLYERAGGIPGFTQFLKDNATGSEDSVALIAGLAAASDAEIKEFMRLYNEANLAHDNATEAQAGITVNVYVNGTEGSASATLTGAAQEIAETVASAIREIEDDKNRRSLIA